MLSSSNSNSLTSARSGSHGWQAGPYGILSCYTKVLGCCAEAELQREVLQEKARATSLEVHVRALCLELIRTRENAGNALQLPLHHNKVLLMGIWLWLIRPAVDGLHGD